MDIKKVVFGLILIAMGLLLLGRSMNLFFFTFGHLVRFLVPFLFILLGIWLIIRKKNQEDQMQAYMKSWSSSIGGSMPEGGAQKSSRSQTEGIAGAEQPAASIGDEGGSPQGTRARTGTVKFSKTLGDLFVDCANISLQHVEISVGVGDAEIKLHGGRLAPGLNRMIVSGFVGDIRIFVPNDMPFYLHCSNFIGDISAGGQRASGFNNSLESQSPNYDTAESKLYIAVSNFLGDVKVLLV